GPGARLTDPGEPSPEDDEGDPGVEKKGRHRPRQRGERPHAGAASRAGDTESPDQGGSPESGPRGDLGAPREGESSSRDPGRLEDPPPAPGAGRPGKVAPRWPAPVKNPDKKITVSSQGSGH